MIILQKCKQITRPSTFLHSKEELNKEKMLTLEILYFVLLCFLYQTLQPSISPNEIKRGTFLSSFLKSPFYKGDVKNVKITTITTKSVPCDKRSGLVLSSAYPINSFCGGSRGRCCQVDISSVGVSTLPMKGCPARLQGAVSQGRGAGIFSITKVPNTGDEAFISRLANGPHCAFSCEGASVQGN